MSSAEFTVYNASAGSGKTFTLVKEYLKIVLISKDPFQFQHILAITFTNKAAAEMKSRVLEVLKCFSIGEHHDMIETISDELELSEEVLKKRAALALQAILQNYSAFNITTIDSFTYRVIRSFAYDLGLSQNFEVEMDVKTLLHEAVDVLISKIGEQKELTETLIKYSLEKLEDHKSWDIAYDLLEISQLLLNENDYLELNAMDDKSLNDYTLLNSHLRQQQKQLEKKLVEVGKTGLELIKKNGLDQGVFKGNYLPKHFSNLIHDFKKAKFFDETKLKSNIENRAIYNKSAESQRAIIDAIEPEILEAYYTSEQIYAQHLLNSMVLKSLIPLAVLKHINGALEELKDQNNIRFNSEFNKIISDQIKNEPAPFIYERLGEKFRYYFIDEMQDTSALQWQNLIPLIEHTLVSEFAPGKAGKLMLVGDAKQAIYRWRGGKSEQFIELTNTEDHKPFSIEKTVMNLKTNFRSFDKIVDFSNSFFTYASDFFHNASYQSLYKIGNQQHANDKKGGYVEISFVDKQVDKQVYAIQVYKKVKALEKQFALREICVLVRTKQQGIEVADVLSENRIPILSSETLILKNNSIIVFIVQILSLFQNPNDTKVKADVIYYLAKKYKQDSEIHDVIANNIATPLEVVFDKIRGVPLQFKLNTFFELSLYDAVEYVIRSFDLLSTSNAYVFAFLDVVLEFQTKKGSSLAGFLEYWEQKKDGLSLSIPEGHNAVNIMTIHRSKGLEFPVVIFPYDLNIYKQIQPKVWYKELDKEYFLGFEKTLISSSKKLSYVNDYGKQRYDTQQSELQLDNLNLLYVALTRPIEQLYIITEKREKALPVESSKTYSDLFYNYLLMHRELWNVQEDQYSKGTNKRDLIYINATEIDDRTEWLDYFISSSLRDHNITIVAKSSILWDSEQETAIQYGNLVHEILSKVKTYTDVNEVVQPYYRNGTLSKTAAQDLEEVINKLVHHPKLKPYYEHNLDILNEQEIMTKSKYIRIPDRIVISDRSATILDYKTGSYKNSHKAQIEDYGFLLEQLGYHVVRKLIVYIKPEIEIHEFE